MPKRSRRYTEIAKQVEPGRQYSLTEAAEIIGKVASARFDETVEVAVKLGVDPRKADQNIRGSVPLPNGLGKEIRVVVFAKGDKVKEAQDAGADLVGAEDLVEKIKDGFQDFDSVVATPDMMVQVGKIGRILGPRGLMPSPKVGTVTFDLAYAVGAIKAGRVEYRCDKAGIVHAPVGKASFGEQKIAENVTSLVQALNRAKPATSKGVYLKGAALSTTMGPGISLDPVSLRSL